jgi:heptosyltransferase-2
VTNPALYAILLLSDLMLAPLRIGRRAGPIAVPRRVLLSINGHLGDAVIATAAIRALRASLPNVELGVVLPSWSRVVVEGDPRVAHVHVVDHWHTSRQSAGPLAKWRRYRATRRRALREIRAVGYDVAVDLYEYFPNAAVLLWRAGIPVRIGFSSAGFSASYTHAVPWGDAQGHTVDRQAALIGLVMPAPTPVAPRYDLPDTPGEAARRVDALLEREGLRPDSYIVVHMGAGSPTKEWPLAHWMTIAAQLVQDGERLVFTGQGPAERDAIHIVTRGLPGCVDLCDRLDWQDYVQVVRRARQVLAVDTVAGHVAAAVGTPSVTLWSGISSAAHWRPLSERSMVIANAGPADLLSALRASADRPRRSREAAGAGS